MTGLNAVVDRFNAAKDQLRKCAVVGSSENGRQVAFEVVE